MRQAEAKGLRPLTREETLAKLHARLCTRARHHGWPKQKGDLHIFLAFGVRNWEAGLPDAFSPFGEVSTFAWTSRGYNRRGKDWWQQRPLMNQDMLAAFHEANARRPVDAVVGYFSGRLVAPKILEEMARSGAAVFNFSYDEKLDRGRLTPDGIDRGPAGLAAVVDLNLTNDPAPDFKYMLKSGLSMFHAEAADPAVHRPVDKPFEYDVTFIGKRYGYRPHFIRRLRDAGINVATFGDGWPNGGVSFEKMIELFSTSRINLGFGGIGHSQRLMCLKGRDFEVPMCGGLYLTQDNQELHLVFDAGSEIVTYSSVEDCIAKIKALLGDEARADAIRKAGRARCLRDHTYEERWSKVFAAAGIMSPETRSSVERPEASCP